MIVIDTDTRDHLLETEDLEDEDFFEIIRKLPYLLNSKDNQEMPSNTQCHTRTCSTCHIVGP